MADIKNFLDAEGRLKQFPSKRRMQLHALCYLGGKFEENKIYTEREINGILLSWHTYGDPATLRRELIELGFLVRTRDCSQYSLAQNPPTIEQLESLL